MWPNAGVLAMTVVYTILIFLSFGVVYEKTEKGKLWISFFKKSEIYEASCFGSK
jgi:hypothetical protein